MRGSMFELALATRGVAGKGRALQLLEAVRLRAGGNSLSVSEYFFYRLFEPALSAQDRARFVGWRREQQIDRALNRPGWRAVANDKLLFYATLEGLGLPYPSLRAIYSPQGRYLKGASQLRTREDLASFARSPRSYPAFAKPLMGSYGRGAFSMLGYDQRADAIRVGDGTSISVAEAVDLFSEPCRGGYLFQNLVEPHPVTVDICGPKVTSARVVMLLGPRGPSLFRCVWKIPTGSNMSDNFMHGETGNLLAHVDPASGRVRRVISGVGLGLRVLDTHPDTDVSFEGVVLPSWPEVRDLCLAAAPCYPGLRLQHWDIALAAQGPMVLEVNVEGSLDLHQLAGGRGVLDQELLDALAAAAAATQR